MTDKEQALKDRIVLNPAILVGKPVVRGTRIPVYLVLQHLAHNLDLDDLFADYPRLAVEDVKSCIAYAATVVANENMYPISVSDGTTVA